MDPLVLEFDVAAPVEHAFSVWTERTGLWWPRSHTIDGARGLSVIFEPFVGGRIYERNPAGKEHEWGEVLAWEPPRRVAYLWHLFFDRTEATEVEVTFEPDPTGTRVRIHQSGWDRLGDLGGERRVNTNRAWSSIIPVYQLAAQEHLSG